MKIENIKINSFGNLENKELNFTDGLNIVYGKNEAGKSTLLKFITNMFYGTSRNKKGREYSDYEKYKPWGKDDFSGKIKYELDNGNEYEVYRDFAKKNPKIFNSNLEDITKEYSIDKSTGSQFFYEQTKVDETTFLSTIASIQQEVKLEKNSQNELVQKMANIAGTGEDNVSYNRAIEKLYKKQLDEIGTNRSQGKPINVAQNRITELKAKRDSLLQYQDQKFNFEENKENIDGLIKNDETKIDFLRNLKIIKNQERIEQEKIEYNQSVLNDKIEEVERIKEEKNSIIRNSNFQNEEELAEFIETNEQRLNELIAKSSENVVTPKAKKSNNTIFIVLLIISIIVNAVLFVAAKSYFKFLGIPVILAVILFYLIYKLKNKHNAQIDANKAEMNKRVEENKILTALNKNKELLNTINSKNAQINIIEKSIQDGKTKINQAKENIEVFSRNEKIDLKERFKEVLESSKIDNFLSIENVDLELEKYLNKLNDRKLEVHRIDLSKQNIMPQLDTLVKIEENLEKTEEEFAELIKRNNAINLAREALESAYEKMKSSVTPKFTENLSNNIKSISNGKYKKVSINDENGLMVELPSGEYVPADKLSLGTIDQLYLSLRLSMCEDVSNENMPLILDEAFAFYDDERLENIIKFLIDNYVEKQIIILTCTSREKEILNKLRYEYNEIVL